MIILSAGERLDLLVPLVAGHLLADFVFQTDGMVAHKDRGGVLLGHVSVVAAASWVLIGHAVGAIPLVLLTSLLHLLIDLGKAAVERRVFGEGGVMQRTLRPRGSGLASDARCSSSAIKPFTCCR